MSTSCSWEGKGRCGSFRFRIERVGMQVKLWDPSRTRAIPVRFWGGFSRRGTISSVCTFTGTSGPVMGCSQFTNASDMRVVLSRPSLLTFQCVCVQHVSMKLQSVCFDICRCHWYLHLWSCKAGFVPLPNPSRSHDPLMCVKTPATFQIDLYWLSLRLSRWRPVVGSFFLHCAGVYVY